MHSKMNRLRSAIITLLCFFVMLAMFTPFNQTVYGEDGENSTDVTYYDGTYEGIGKGHRGDIKVNVTITDGAISGIEVTGQGETPDYWAKLLDGEKNTLIESILSEQNADVDGITGATNSSNGIKEAVKDALEKASVDPDGWYDSGEGTENKPFVINTADQLSKFALAVDEGESFEGQYVALGSDIDLSETENWNPIGTEGATGSASKFAGTFDGRSHSVSNMTYVREGLSTETNIGFFSALAPTAVVKNLSLSNVEIDIMGSAVLRAGGIAGDTVNGSSDAGTHFDKVSVSGSVSADSTGAALVYAGGIIGRAMTWVKVSNSWTDVDATAISRGGNNSGYAGGIFGMSGNNTLIVNVATFGDSYGNSPKSTNFGGMAGGLGGMLTSKTYNTYVMGNATVGNSGVSHKWVGALAGEFPTSGMIKLSDGNYAYPETGAFRDYGYYPNDAVLTVEKWSGDSSTAETTELRAAGTSPTMSTHDKVIETKCVAMNRSDMATQDFADRLNANLKNVRKLLDAYGYTDVVISNWEVAGDKVLPTGSKWVNKDPDASIFAGGTGTEDDPYRIETEDELRAFAGSLTDGIDYVGSYVKVMNDVDISSEQWNPIGGQDYAFDGTFDGGGYNISGMKAGTEESPYVMGRDNPYMGFFGVLGKNAVVKDVNLTGVDIYATTPQYVYLGGIAAINDASSDTKKAMVIDGCSVKGKMTAVANKSNAMVGGIIAQQYRGAIINCMTDMDLKCTVKTGNAIAEVGGLVGLNNRGLVANSYTLGNVFGSASRNNGDEGMASTGNLVGVQAGDLVGCYSRGDNTTAEYSVYAGELAGWITGIGKVYSCYYNKEAKMSIDGRAVNPPADFGTKVAPGVNEEGDAYVGGIVDDLNAYTSSDYSGITDKLNSRFSEYPTDIEIYGITGAALKKWKYDSESETVTFGSERAEITYKQPQAEIVPPDVEELYDGTWYGRDDNKKVVVKISTVDGEVSGNPEVVSGDASDEEAYENAVSRARTKALYGDTTGYGEADTKLFGGGKGTKEEPYLISNEAQLRAIAESLNEDETFADVYFKQTADIDVSSAEWLPIGHAVMAKVKKAWTQVASYPFLGNYDGDSFTISGVTIGSLENPSSNPRVNFTAGLFGFVTGDHYSNAKIPNDVRISTLENIKLRDVDISVTSEGQNYTAGLVGNIQNGFLIDNCSVTGCVSSYSKDSFARGAGIAGNAIRGTVLNTWTDVDVYAQTDAGNVYAGGLYAIDNRTTSINCYSTSSITANAAANNKVHIGGLSGQAGGVHYNCYASGDVSSLKTTSDAGIVEGRLAGIAVDSKVYYKGNAKLKIAGTLQDTAAIGVSVPDNPDVVVKSASQMASKDFAGLLNQNADAASSDVESLQNIIDSQTDLTHVVQFSGKKEDLATWIIAEGRAVLLDKNLIKKADEEEARKKAEEEAAKAAEKEAHEAELKTAKEALAKAQKARAAAELKLAKRVKTVTVNAATVNATAINKAVKAAGGSSKYVTKIVLGKKVKRISKGAFKSYTKVKTLEIRSKKLKKNYVRGSLKNSKVTTIKVNVGKKKANMTYVNKYKKIFTKKNVGKKVKIKL